MKKRSYSSPNIKVVAFKVEEGFAGSPNELKVGKWTTDDHDQIVPETQGVQDFGYDTWEGF